MERCIACLNAILAKLRLNCLSLTVEIPFVMTGCRNKMTSEQLNEVQDTVWNNPAFQARDGKTFCNQASLAVANGIGCHEFDPPKDGDPYTADQLFNFFQRSTSNFLEKNMEDVQALANKGALVFASLPSWRLDQAHGHICSLTPGDQVKSYSLDTYVPVCLNLSTQALSSRRVGINFAFPMKRAMPRYFVWKGSL